ncbi:hypothetical protein B0H19DRAFT_1069384 [Mycena capillaripes]|nr:hypothetical protein B0H19DRAFT_1069384 [Mycena capillaripes]
MLAAIANQEGRTTGNELAEGNTEKIRTSWRASVHRFGYRRTIDGPAVGGGGILCGRRRQWKISAPYLFERLPMRRVAGNNEGDNGKLALLSVLSERLPMRRAAGNNELGGSVAEGGSGKSTPVTVLFETLPMRPAAGNNELRGTVAEGGSRKLAPISGEVVWRRRHSGEIIAHWRLLWELPQFRGQKTKSGVSKASDRHP